MARSPDDRGGRREEKDRLRERAERAEARAADLEARLDLQRRIHETAQELCTLDPAGLARTAVKRISALLRARRVSLYLYDYDGETLSLAAHSPGRPAADRVRLRRAGRTVMAEALARREPVLVSSFADYARERGVRLPRPPAGRYEGESFLSVPLTASSVIVGVLNATDRTKGLAFDRDTLGLLEPLWRLLAAALRNARLFREVQSQAHTDALTRLRNYRAFHESLKAEMHRCARYGRPLGLLRLDVDSFKQINDRHGHPAGDAALARLGEIVRDAVRREDIPARYGGDEIAVILPETPPEGCRIVAERLVEAVRGADFLYQGRRLSVSVSAGLAFYRPNLSAPRLLREADDALYRSKRTGKNRVTVSSRGPVPVS